MANSKQQIKRAKTDEKRRNANVMLKSSLNRAINLVEQHVEANDKDKALEAFATANKKLDKAQNKGIFHKNYVARHRSRLAKMINEL